MNLNKSQMAIRFGENADGGYFRHNGRYNYLMSIVATDDTTHDVSEMSGFSIPVNAGSIIRRPFRIGDDYNFQVLGVKLSAYYLDESTWRFFESDVNRTMAAQETFETQLYKGVPYENYLRTALSVSAPNGNYLYGGPDFSSNKAGQMSYLKLETSQGIGDGYGQIKIPYMVPKQGILTLEIHNTHPDKLLKVAGFIYGEKVRI